MSSLATTRLDKVKVAIKPKLRPELTRFEFDKTKPLGPYNFPQMSYAKYKVFGYTVDAAGIHRPHPPIERMLPMGRRVRLAKKDLPPGFVVTGCQRAVGGPILK